MRINARVSSAVLVAVFYLGPNDGVWAAEEVVTEDPFSFCATFGGTAGAPMWNGKQRPIALSLDNTAGTVGAWKLSADILTKLKQAPGRRILLRESVVSGPQKITSFKNKLSQFSGDITVPFFDALGTTNGVSAAVKVGFKALLFLINKLGEAQAVKAAELAAVMEEGAAFEEHAYLSQNEPFSLTALTTYRVKVAAVQRRYGICSTTAAVLVN